MCFQVADTFFMSGGFLFLLNDSKQDRAELRIRKIRKLLWQTVLAANSLIYFHSF